LNGELFFRGSVQKIAGFTLVFTLVSILTASFVSAANTGPPAKEAVIAVRGMVCSSCAQAVEKALRKLDGIAEVRVELKNDRVRVRYDGKRVTPQQMVEVVRKSGYEARWSGR
jgi:copper chaperone CopZ